MKSFFKKTTKESKTVVKLESLGKNQMKKIFGGTDSITASGNLDKAVDLRI